MNKLSNPTSKTLEMLHHPAVQLPLYGALAGGDIAAGIKERKEGGSGFWPFAGAAALGMMGAPYAIETAQKVPGLASKLKGLLSR